MIEEAQFVPSSLLAPDWLHAPATVPRAKDHSAPMDVSYPSDYPLQTSSLVDKAFLPGDSVDTVEPSIVKPKRPIKKLD